MKDAKVIELEEVAIRFSGDSGDGMQLTGTLFSDTSALFEMTFLHFRIIPLKSGHLRELLVVYQGFRYNLGKRKLPHREIWLMCLLP